MGTVSLAEGCDVVCIFAGDTATAPVLHDLAASGVRHIAIRAAGYDNVDLQAASALGISVANVPEYSPHAIAEHAVALMLALNRELVLANTQVHAHDFTIEKLVGFDLHGKTVGIIGTGRIGATTAGILHGFGCKLLGHDLVETPALKGMYGLEYTNLKSLCEQSDIITLHTSLTPETKYLIGKSVISTMRRGVMLINTSRGALVNTADVIEGLQSGHIGWYGADVYEHEKGVFFYDRSDDGFEDELLEGLLRLPNVLVTPHQAFATGEALGNIADTTFYNIGCWAAEKQSENELHSEPANQSLKKIPA